MINFFFTLGKAHSKGKSIQLIKKTREVALHYPSTSQDILYFGHLRWRIILTFSPIIMTEFLQVNLLLVKSH